jgi:predicted polyphosphate/ATP-dependent NAD kinase
MPRLGLLVNPDAGLGGRLGLKGSDGQAEYARSQGAEDRSGPRMRAMLEHFSAIAGAKSEECHWVTSDGRMGSEWIPESISEIEFAHSSKGPTSANDTSDAISSLLDSGIDLLVYAGGDGTTRDIVSALSEADSPKLPVIGVPTGVKMHSGCFASSPKAAAEVLASWIAGDLLIASTEVLDLDEELYRQGKWVVRIYAEAMTPSSPRWMQGAKMRVEASGEGEIVEGIAEHIEETLIEDERLVLWGSGGTLRSIGEMIGFELTTLGIDATKGSQQVGTDINEKEILEILGSHEGPVTLLLSPMGGQGFLIGRGNLQLSPSVLRKVGVEGVLGIVTPAKLLTLRSLRIETGDDDLDRDFSEKKYLKVLQGYRTTRVLPVSVD